MVRCSGNRRRHREGCGFARRCACIFLLIRKTRQDRGCNLATGSSPISHWNKRRNGGEASSLCSARGGGNTKGGTKKTGRRYNLTFAAHLRRAIVMAFVRAARVIMAGHSASED